MAIVSYSLKQPYPHRTRHKFRNVEMYLQEMNESTICRQYLVILIGNHLDCHERKQPILENAVTLSIPWELIE